MFFPKIFMGLERNRLEKKKETYYIKYFNPKSEWAFGRIGNQ